MTATICQACGATIDEGAASCAICGSPAAPQTSSSRRSATSPGARGEDPSSAGWASAGSQPPPPATGIVHPASGSTSEQRGWSIGAHLGALGLALTSAAVLGFVAPLVIWLIRRDEDPFTEHHAKESLNFQLTVLLAIVVSAVLLIPGVIIGVLTLGVGFVIGGVAVAAAMVAWLVFPIVAAVKASNGEGYRYPVTIRFIS